MENFKNIKIIIGLIKIARSKIETTDEIKFRINKTLQYTNKEQLIAAPDCGLGLLPRDIALTKLKILVNAVKEY